MAELAMFRVFQAEIYLKLSWSHCKRSCTSTRVTIVIDTLIYDTNYNLIDNVTEAEAWYNPIVVADVATPGVVVAVWDYSDNHPYSYTSVS